MTEETKTGTDRPGWFWFRWLPRGFLLAVALMPAFYVMFYYIIIKELGPQHWSYSEITLSVFLLVVFLVAWWAPIIGGIMAIVATPLIVYVYTLMAWAAGLSDEAERALLIFSSLLIIGGVLSIIYGIRRWWWRRKGGQA